MSVAFQEISFADEQFANPDLARRERERKQHEQRANEFTAKVTEIARVGALHVYAWLSAALQDRVAGYMATREALKARAKETCQPINDAVKSLGEGDPFQLFAAIDAATMNSKTIYAEAAAAAIEGIAIIKEAIPIAESLLANADAEVQNATAAAEKAASENGWPRESFPNQAAWQFFINRQNVNVRKARAASDEIKEQINSLRTEQYTLQQRVQEIKSAAAKAAMDGLKV